MDQRNHTVRKITRRFLHDANRQLVPLLRFFEDHLRNFVVTFARANARGKARLEFRFNIFDRAIRYARRARIRFQVTALTALAPTRVLGSIDHIVTRFPAVAMRPVPNVTVQNDSATYPRSKSQKNKKKVGFAKKLVTTVEVQCWKKYNIIDSVSISLLRRRNVLEEEATTKCVCEIF